MKQGVKGQRESRLLGGFPLVLFHCPFDLLHLRLYETCSLIRRAQVTGSDFTIWLDPLFLLGGLVPHRCNDEIEPW